MSASNHMLCEAMKKSVHLPPLSPSTWVTVIDSWSKYWHDQGFNYCPYCGWRLSPYYVAQESVE